MRLVVFSHKETWASSMSPAGYVTVGGFPFQMQAISELFDQTTVVVPIRETPVPNGALPLIGKNLSVKPVEEPVGQDLRRKISLLSWLPRNFSKLWMLIKKADAVHAPVPGDIGTIGLLIALAQQKPLFVRHCGTWRSRSTLADRFLDWLLPRIAGGRNVVMATGGGDELPCPKNPNIQWIFSTSLSKSEWYSISQAQPWSGEGELKLITVGRLSESKNIQSIIQALPAIKKQHPEIHLDILGDGAMMPELKSLAGNLGMSEFVTFHGNVSHNKVLQSLSQAHVFVFPTQTKEGFPKAVLEAMACGLPVIATGVSVLPRLISSENGIVLSQTDHESVAEAVLEAASDPKRLAKMGSSARETSKKYTLEKWRDTIGERLEKAWGKPLRDHG